jgi:hypothetical protein
MLRTMTIPLRGFVMRCVPLFVIGLVIGCSKEPTKVTVVPEASPAIDLAEQVRVVDIDTERFDVPGKKVRNEAVTFTIRNDSDYSIRLVYVEIVGLDDEGKPLDKYTGRFLAYQDATGIAPKTGVKINYMKSPMQLGQVYSTPVKSAKIKVVQVSRTLDLEK